MVVVVGRAVVVGIFFGLQMYDPRVFKQYVSGVQSSSFSAHSSMSVRIYWTVQTTGTTPEIMATGNEFIARQMV